MLKTLRERAKNDGKNRDSRKWTMKNEWSRLLTPFQQMHTDEIGLTVERRKWSLFDVWIDWSHVRLMFDANNGEKREGAFNRSTDKRKIKCRNNNECLTKRRFVRSSRVDHFKICNWRVSMQIKFADKIVKSVAAAQWKRFRLNGDKTRIDANDDDEATVTSREDECEIMLSSLEKCFSLEWNAHFRIALDYLDIISRSLFACVYGDSLFCSCFLLAMFASHLHQFDTIKPWLERHSKRPFAVDFCSMSALASI